MTRARLNPGLALAVVWLLPVPCFSAVVVNEVMADNDSTIEDPDEPGRYEDWIELYNDGDSPVDLSGSFVTDEPGDPTKWRIPAGVTIGAGEHLLLWADDDEEQGGLHMSFELQVTGEFIGLYDADGATLLDGIQFDAQEADLAFGRSPDGTKSWCFVSEPTPGATNSGCGAGRPAFSRPGGTFSGTFELELLAPFPDAILYYTVDGDEPTDESGTLYTGPITIERSTWVRARSYVAERDPGAVTSRVYVALSPGVEEFDSNLPIVLINTFGRNIDSDCQTGRPFRPVMSVFIDTGEVSGRARITDAADHAGYAGMHVRGQSTCSYPKKQYAFETWDEDGRDKNVSLLGFDRESDWVLHAPYSDKTLMRNHLMYSWSRRIGRYAVRTRFVEVFVDNGARTSSSDYRGVYVFMERIKRDDNRVDIARLRPEHDSEPEISGGYLLKKDWYGGEDFFTTSVYRDGLIYVDPPGDELTTAQRSWIRDHFNEFERALSGAGFADPDTGYGRYIDVLSWIDHHLLVEMARNVDGFVLSTHLFKDRGGKIKMGPIWDYNGSLGGADYFCSYEPEGWHHEFNERDCGNGGESFPADNPNGYRWYERIFRDPAFQRRYAERWAELRADELSTERLLADIDEVVDLLTDGGAAESPVTRNFERWNILDRYVWPNFVCCGPYERHVEWLRDYLGDRLAWMDSELTVPPEFSHPGGPVSPGFELEITGSGGEILFTLNGPDPRRPDGAVDPAARAYRDPIVISGNTRVRARIRISDSVWSELVEASYVTDVPRLLVTEIMYDPPRLPEDAFTRSRYEFLELQNAGDTDIELEGFRILRRTGADLLVPRFEFTAGSVTRLAPGEYVVVARDLSAFESRYGPGLNVAGSYTSTLSNRGDAIVVLGPLDEPVIDFEYDGEWYPSTRGEGASLVLVSGDVPPEQLGSPASWRPSVETGGSPGRADELVVEPGLQRIGDLNQDGGLDLSDAVLVLRFLFHFGVELPCETPRGNDLVLDSNSDQRIDLADPVHVLNYLFQGGPLGGLSLECVAVDGCPAACGG